MKTWKKLEVLLRSRIRQWVLVFVLGFNFLQQAAALQSGEVSIMLTSGPLLLLNSKGPCTDGPRGAYVAVEVCNRSGRTLSGLQVSLGGLASGFSLAGGQIPTHNFNQLAPGACQGFFWFISYPCISGIPTGLNISVADNQPGVVTSRFTVRTAAVLGAQAGGTVASATAGPNVRPGETTWITVRYDFGQIPKSGELYLQPVGNLGWDAGCFELTGMDVLSTTVPNIVASGITNKMYFNAPVKSPSTANYVECRYYFHCVCADVNTYAAPYAAGTSGNQLKITSDLNTRVTLPDLSQPSCAGVDFDQFASPLSAAQSGIQTNGGHWGLAWGDYDNDGFPDLFLTTYDPGASNILFHNNGNGTFSKVTSGSIATDKASSLGATWGDYDNDGDLDLFVANNVGSPNFLYRNGGGGNFERILNDPAVDDKGYAHGASWVDYDLDGYLDLFTADYFPTGFNKLYHNNGDGTFSKVTGNSIAEEAASSVSGAWGDYDNDGLPDLFVANTNSENNSLHRNLGGGRFAKISSGPVVSSGGSSVGGSWGDYDNDGRLDLFVANSGGQDNFLYHNDGGGNFTAIHSQSIVHDGGHSHGSLWFDYDNDGDLDLLVTNNQYEGSFLYRNDGFGTFTKISNALTSTTGASFAASAVDYDNDGDLDVFIINNDGTAPFFFENTTGQCNNSILIDLLGAGSNKLGIGAKVTVIATVNGKRITQTKILSAQSGGGVGAQSDTRLHFGLGDAAVIESIVVNWPSGNSQTLLNQAPGPYLQIAEPSTATITGLAYVDQNNNCIRDAGEPILPNAELTLAPGNYKVYADINGEFSASVPVGTYSLSGISFENWQSACAGQSVRTTSLSQTYSGYSVGFKSSCSGADLQMEMASTAQRVGFKNVIAMNLRNEGSSTATNVLVNVDFGSSIVPLYSSLPWSNATGSARQWILPELLPGQLLTIYIGDSVKTTTTIGSNIVVNGSISATTSECNPADNSYQLTTLATGAVDPNDLLVFPGGPVTTGGLLEYKVRFQNVGNVPVSNVRITMTLPPTLDINSLQLGVAGHPYRFSIQDKRRLVWEFPNINLPDSIRNEPESHGFVILRVRAAQDLSNGDVIRNMAQIFFDNQAPIGTNVTENDIQSGSAQLIAAEPLLIWPNPSGAEVNFSIPKDPSKSSSSLIDWIRIVDWSGKLVVDRAVQPVDRLAWYDLPVGSGVYLVQARSAQRWYIGKWMVMQR